jgi:hypothetical protein
MARNPDPKPGRWILPLVIVGMVGFTYLFVQSIDQPEVPDNAGSSSTTTTTVDGDDGTTTTTGDTVPAIPSDVQGYLDSLDAHQETLDDLVQRMNQANADWDNRTVGLSDTTAALENLAAETTTFADTVATSTPPAGYPELALAHEEIISAAAAAKTAADDVYDGLVNSATADPRRTALVQFNEAASAFGTAVDAAKAAGAA